jgi:hypothetical protein
MAISDDIVKGLRNPTPLYAVAGTADLAAEKLKEVPALLDRLREEAPERFGKLRSTDPKDVQERVTAGARDAQAKLTGTFSELDLKELRDLRKLGESVQGLALQGVGRAAEYAVRTRETYDGLAERGKDAVAKWRGEGGGTETKPGEITGKAAAAPRTGSRGAVKQPKDTSAPAVHATPAKKPAARKPAQKKPAE